MLTHIVSAVEDSSSSNVPGNNTITTTCEVFSNQLDIHPWSEVTKKYVESASFSSSRASDTPAIASSTLSKVTYKTRLYQNELPWQL